MLALDPSTETTGIARTRPVVEVAAPSPAQLVRNAPMTPVTTPTPAVVKIRTFVRFCLERPSWYSGQLSP